MFLVLTRQTMNTLLQKHIKLCFYYIWQYINQICNILRSVSINEYISDLCFAMIKISIYRIAFSFSFACDSDFYDISLQIPNHIHADDMITYKSHSLNK